jgi:uncharacterized membrane protein YgdD (TMEM256/DUF423 family)
VKKRALSIGAFSAALAVLLGAFGAHALKERIAADPLLIFETGVRYQMYHAFGLMAAGILLSTPTAFRQKLLVLSAWFFLLGSFLFPGSLYALALTGIRSFGALTPLGGGAFVAGWLTLGAAVLPHAGTPKS